MANEVNVLIANKIFRERNKINVQLEKQNLRR